MLGIFITVLFWVAFLPVSASSMDIFLLIGQSNMRGRGKVEDQDTAVIEGVLLLNLQNEWEPAKNPLARFAQNEYDDRAMISPGYTFSTTIMDSTDLTQIGLVVDPQPTTRVEQWQKGHRSGLYASAVARTNTALALEPNTTLKAILWHQGESDAEQANAYMGKLKAMVADLRAEFKNPQLPFVVGELAQWSYPGRPSTDPMNRVLKSVPDSISHTSVVSSDGLTGRDKWHFDRESQLILGARYAEKVLELVYRGTPVVRGAVNGTFRPARVPDAWIGRIKSSQPFGVFMSQKMNNSVRAWDLLGRSSQRPEIIR